MPRLLTLRPNHSIIFVVSVLLTSLFYSSSAVLGQAEPQKSAAPSFRYTVHFTSDTGAYTYVPERWGELRITMVNGLNESRDLLCATTFEQDAGLQFGRTVWMPPASLLRTNHPIRVPVIDPKAGTNIKLQSLISEKSGGNEVLVKTEEGQMRHESAMIITREERNTGIIGPPVRSTPTKRNDVADLVVAARIKQSLNNRYSFLEDRFMPIDQSSLDPYDHIVVADDTLIHDHASALAVRQWLYSGGRLWVMLDLCSPEVLEVLLGDDFTGHVIDRVGLNTVRVDQTPLMIDGEVTVGEEIVYDDPVTMARIVGANMNVRYTVNGWPAALTKNFGDGRLLVTTLGAPALMKPLQEKLQRTDNPLLLTQFTPTGPMGMLADFILGPRVPELLPAVEIESQAQDYVGYSVLSWWLVVGTLLAFSATILGVGLILLRWGSPEQLSWIGSILAIIVSAILIQSGRANRNAIPPTLASIQLTQAVAGTDNVRSSGLITVYQPDGSNFPIAATRGGRLMPDVAGSDGAARRLVLTDLGQYHWENVPQPAGLRSTPFKQFDSLTSRLQARVTFNPTGVEGKYEGEFPPGTDPIVVTQFGRMGLTMKGDGTFSGRVEDVFENDQFVAAGLLSDEQDRRRVTLKNLLEGDKRKESDKRKDFPDSPQLMFWTTPRDDGFRFGDNLKLLGSTLVSIPLTFERPAGGQEIVIPSPFLLYAVRQNPDGTSPSAMWSSIDRKWQERATPGLNWLSFQIPRELLPLTARRARVDLKVTGPVGRIEIFGLKEGTPTSLKTVIDPIGSVAIDLNEADALVIDQEGRLSLGLSAGDASRPELTHGNSASGGAGGQPQASSGKVNYWRIESLALQLWAVTTDLAKKD